MTCYHPLQAYRSYSRVNENGKQLIVFDPKRINGPMEVIRLPCGRCLGCRIDRSREWALRCVHEASLWRQNCFITLTFNDENMDPQGSLRKEDFQKFMKRLRKRFSGRTIRYYHCGEYGSNRKRPHHHACLFNLDFPDKQLWNIREGVPLYRSAMLEELWPFGFSSIGAVTFESAAYCARYITKKVLGDQAGEAYRRVDRETGEIYEIVPEYNTMSRRPGLARAWMERYAKDVYPKDFVTRGGKKLKPPRYYDRIYDEMDHEGMERLRAKRKAAARERADDNTARRLRVREKVATAKMKKLKRGLDDDSATLCDV